MGQSLCGIHFSLECLIISENSVVFFAFIKLTNVWLLGHNKGLLLVTVHAGR